MNLAYWLVTHLGKQILTSISVSGLAEHEVVPGLADFLGEFKHRPWYSSVAAEWHVSSAKLFVSAQCEGNDLKFCERAFLDELQDCVVAYFKFDSDLHFAIEECREIAV